MLTHKKCEIKDGKVDSNKIEQDGDSLEIKRSSGHFHDVMNFIKLNFFQRHPGSYFKLSPKFKDPLKRM